ncbi:MAG: LysR family transcriptional regulator [Bacteroidaceae bacterium]|nr:LysR family transcriptional regulator [Bacteroidaceae bacterium]
MEIRQLRYFAKVAETLNFSDAAKALYITQSTLSQQIKQLEQELNAPLLLRNSHSVSLTEVGEELLPYALRTLHAADLCVDRIHDLQQLLTGTLNIGVTYTFSPILAETLLVFMKRYPHVRLNIYYKPMEELMELLSNRKVDFVLAFKSSVCHDEIESHILFDNHLAVIAGDSHPLAKKDKVKLGELEPYDIALPSKGLQARNALDKALSKYMTKLRVRLELNEVNILLKLVKQSQLVTVLAEATIRNEQGIKAVPLDFPENEMAGCVHVLRNTYRKHSMQEFIRLLSEANAVKERIHDWL